MLCCDFNLHVEYCVICLCIFIIFDLSFLPEVIKRFERRSCKEIIVRVG